MQLLALAGILLLFGAGVTLASAAGKPPPTATESTGDATATPTFVVHETTPTSDFGWELVRPGATHPRPPAPPPASAPMTPAAPAQTPITTAAAPRRPHVKHVKARRRRQPVPRPARVVQPQRTRAVLRGPATAGRTLLASAFTVAALALAIALFAVGSAPGQLRWRHSGVFVAYHRSQVTVAGVLSLLLAALVYVVTQGR
jgi:hypothetical protein